MMRGGAPFEVRGEEVAGVMEYDITSQKKVDGDRPPSENVYEIKVGDEVLGTVNFGETPAGLSFESGSKTLENIYNFLVKKAGTKKDDYIYLIQYHPVVRHRDMWDVYGLARILKGEQGGVVLHPDKSITIRHDAPGKLILLPQDSLDEKQKGKLGMA